MKEKAIAVGKSLCDTMMRKYDAPELPPKQTFLYHQGVFLSGMLNVYKICNEEKYFEYAKKWVDSIIDKDGNILEYDYNNTEVIQPGIDKRSIDHIQPGILLYRLYEKTGDERYKIALKTLMNILKDWPKNKAGGFWHKECHPYQMWLDSLYMGGPIRAEYAASERMPAESPAFKDGHLPIRPPAFRPNGDHGASAVARVSPRAGPSVVHGAGMRHYLFATGKLAPDR